MLHFLFSIAIGNCNRDWKFQPREFSIAIENDNPESFQSQFEISSPRNFQSQLKTGKTNFNRGWKKSENTKTHHDWKTSFPIFAPRLMPDTVVVNILGFAFQACHNHAEELMRERACLLDQDWLICVYWLAQNCGACCTTKEAAGQNNKQSWRPWTSCNGHSLHGMVRLARGQRIQQQTAPKQ